MVTTINVIFVTVNRPIMTFAKSVCCGKRLYYVVLVLCYGVIAKSLFSLLQSGSSKTVVMTSNLIRRSPTDDTRVIITAESSTHLVRDEHGPGESSYSVNQDQQSLKYNVTMHSSTHSDNNMLSFETPSKHIAVSELVDAAAAKNTSTVLQWSTFEASKLSILAYFFRRPFCEKICDCALNSTSRVPVVLNITQRSSHIFQKSIFGTGNHIAWIYAVRLAARANKLADIALQCVDAEEQKKNLILPWLMGWFPESTNPPPLAPLPPNIEKTCSTFQYNPIGYMIQEMQHDLRRMAIALVGIPYKGHPSEAFAEKYLWGRDKASESIDDGDDNHQRYMQLPNPRRGDPPLYPNVTIDDAMIHFRCGDLMSGKYPGYFFTDFQDHARHLKATTRSIGIITQPFESQDRQQRRYDRTGGAKCKVVVHAFIDYLQKRFPNVQVTVYNDAKETIALSYARMIMANQSVSGMSSYGVFASLASFGTGYIQVRDKPGERSWWLNDLKESPDLIPFTNNIEFYNITRKLNTIEVKRMWQKDESGKLMIHWMTNNSL